MSRKTQILSIAITGITATSIFANSNQANASQLAKKHEEGKATTQESRSINSFSSAVQKEEGLKNKRLVEELVKKAPSDNPSALALAQAYWSAKHDLSRDYKKSFKYYLMAAQNGSAEGCLRTAVMLHSGQGTNKDAGQAIIYFKKALQLRNDGEASWSLAVIYREGLGVEKNLELAEQYIAKAAEFKYPAAMREQAQKMLKDPEQSASAINLLQEGTKAGDPAMAYDLAQYYYDNDKIHNNKGKAREILKQFIRKPAPRIWGKLGSMLILGEGGNVDLKTGFRLLESAANSGHRPSQEILAYEFYKGHNLKHDYVAAYYWANLATVNLNKSGKNTAAMLRDEIATKMTPAMIEKAQGHNTESK